MFFLLFFCQSFNVFTTYYPNFDDDEHNWVSSSLYQPEEPKSHKSKEAPQTSLLWC